MAVGLPCVVASIAAHRELAARNGDIAWLVPESPTAGQLAAALVDAAQVTRSVSEGSLPAGGIPTNTDGWCRVGRAQAAAQARYHIMRSVGQWEQFLYACHREWTDHALYPPLNIVGPG